MNSKPWVILIASLPTQNASGRMRIWRGLKAMGCAVLRDGVYLLPNRPEFHLSLQHYSDEVLAGGGTAHVLQVDGTNEIQQKTFEALFDRSADYADLLKNIERFDRSHQDTGKLQKQLNRLRKDFEALVSLDFFPGAAREQAASALEELEYMLHDTLCPDEPRAVQRPIKSLNRDDYQGRTWATRHRPKIDRLASAWLIRRFIDTKARFIWLTNIADCPADALGFDFDGAAFTHIDAKVTYEVLQASFGLTQNAGLHKIGAIVHYLDVGGIAVPEAAGLEALLTGMWQTWSDDDHLLFEAEKIFDAFYQAFSGIDA
ncbi:MULTISPECIES: chromate resistance protein ChrB domain-containing protein [Methylomonas]|uniref:Chromate resistance protein n=2 Tax=Methylomonas TaxID=416 RepID=A0A140E638_9GAMM|nr:MULTISPECIES: chromate resistance protein ChrB domain-containing protein [Methylomonas]AMK78862.1 hypothetical protein JT25_020640 [Methylomonas denitrificans]OAI02136.1 hypothetical protein A1342_02570 [Methylomonas methanica]